MSLPFEGLQILLQNFSNIVSVCVKQSITFFCITFSIIVGVNSILYQRGLYPPESFKRVSQYGLTMLITTDETLTEYIENIMKQLHGIGRLIML